MSIELTQALSELAEINPRVDLNGIRGDTPVSFIPMSDVSDSGQWTGRQERRLDEVRQGYTSFVENDLLFAKITPCMENGKGAHATGLKNGVGFGSTEFHVLRARGDNNSRFLFHWLQARVTRTKAIAYMGGSAGQQRVQAEFFSYFRIPRIEPREQSGIAAVLDTIDEAIAKTEAVIAKLKQVHAGLLHDLLTRGLDENGQLRDRVAHPEQFQDSPLGRIPREWEIQRLSGGCSVLGGKRLPTGHTYAELPTGYCYLRVLDFFERQILFSELVHLRSETFDTLCHYEIRDGELFVSIAGSLGFCGTLRIPNKDRIILTENAARIHINSGFIPEFLALLMNGESVQRQISAEKGIGAGVPKLALFRIERLWLPRPDEREQERILGQLSDFEQSMEAERRELGKVYQLKSGLMNDLLTGRVRVPEGIAVT